MQTFCAFLLAVLVSVVVGATNMAIVPPPKAERPPGVYSFVTGKPKAERLALIEPKEDERVTNPLVPVRVKVEKITQASYVAPKVKKNKRKHRSR